MVIVLSVKLANANHVFRGLANPTRRAIVERVAGWRRNESRTMASSQCQSGKDEPCKSN
jgi:hypothetical protein